MAGSRHRSGFSGNSDKLKTENLWHLGVCKGHWCTFCFHFLFSLSPPDRLFCDWSQAAEAAVWKFLGFKKILVGGQHFSYDQEPPPHSSHPMKYERIYVKGDPVAATSTTRAALKQQLYQDVYHVMYLQLFRIELLLYRYATMNSTFFCHVPVIHNSDKMSSNWSVTISFECKCKLPSFII